MRARWVVVALAAATLGLGYVARVGVPVERYRDDLVRAGEIRTLLDVLSVHVGPSVYLTVADNTFRRVRGFPPYYLRVDGTKTILFVTERAGFRVDFHVVDTATGKHIKIDGGSSGFGHEIGKPRNKVGDPWSDYIESYDGVRITIVKRVAGRAARETLNLSTQQVERRETQQER